MFGRVHNRCCLSWNFVRMFLTKNLIYSKIKAFDYNSSWVSIDYSRIINEFSILLFSASLISTSLPHFFEAKEIFLLSLICFSFSIFLRQKLRSLMSGLSSFLVYGFYAISLVCGFFIQFKIFSNFPCWFLLWDMVIGYNKSTLLFLGFLLCFVFSFTFRLVINLEFIFMSGVR